ncbi:Regulator of nonsense transcripts 1 like [Apostasia shenzhenica]|uniref:Regulator of nonsense transcripts 1 like n=1 Tax=Apostasia shenzhenica TaxID=1088818 RepID=A0A2I0AWW6_9ASPA|nr:Regulator of nonsense transcripts 1 like [Apostasia shenzhenica]
MPKVYGTGTYDFRRHRVAEYPFELGHAAMLPEKSSEQRPGGNISSSITLVEIQRDRLTKIAAAKWLKTADSETLDRQFDAELVKEIYETELLVSGGRKTVPLQRVMILEVSQYLENYLWPNFDAENATFEHVMSMILMVNEKFRENVAAWTCFHDRKEAFRGFLRRVLRLKEEIHGGGGYGLVYKDLLPKFGVVGLPKKFAGPESSGSKRPIVKQMELCLNPHLIRKWRKMIKKEARESKKLGKTFDPSTVLEVTFLRDLIEEYLEILDSNVILLKQTDAEGNHFGNSYDKQVDDSCVLYCERFMEFLIDLLSQLPTRRFLKAVIADVAVVPKCHLSALYSHRKGRLFSQLVDLLQFYEGFEIDDHTGSQMGDDDLRDFALCNIGAIHKRSDLSKKLSILTAEELQDLVCNKLKLVSEEDLCASRVEFLIEVLVAFFEKRQSQKEAINALPLYPNEKIMWDESVVPSINYSGEGCLALPKLNLQFLTLHDYLLRNFNLFRLELTYEIREDIQEAVPHLLAYINKEGEAAFRGWSRMAVPIKEFRVTEVKQPNIGEVKPSSVTAEVTFSISSYKSHIRSEWDAIKEHDVLFLLSLRPSFEPLSPEEVAKSTVPEQLGLQFVRGCEVIEIRDEEGILMNDFTGRIKRDEWKPPKGELRTIVVALDTAQHHMDVTDVSGKDAEDVCFVKEDLTEDLDPHPPFRIELPNATKRNKHTLPGDQKSNDIAPSGDKHMPIQGSQEEIIVKTYIPPDPGPYPQDQPKQNSVRFTPTQVGAIISGIQPGLTMVVGPPGTGKTDTAVQILNVLYHNCPSQRTLIITHSNQALNDLFEKIMLRDVPARYLLRLGQGEQELATDLDFSRQGRVNAMLVRRLELLSEVERMARSLKLPEDVGYTCETAGYFWLFHVYSRWEQFLDACAQNKDKPAFVRDRFPFSDFFSNTPRPVFTGDSFEKDMRAAEGCFRHLSIMFQELEECRAFELLKSTADRANYLMTKQAKIVAMTCTHAALKRKDFLQLGFKYDNLLMEESAQILEIETFIPMLLQRQEDGYARLKRCILIGDHHQLPPVVKNMAFQKYSHMDQSLFTRFVRLGIPYIELNAQGRARPSLAKLYNWRYRDLGDLPFVRGEPVFHKANAGFSYEYQLIDVPDYHGKGETAPSPWFYQNEGEAEFIVSVTTVDKFQGQQNDFILLSLVRTRFVGHLRDVRRLIVAMSRARLGLYVFCCRSLFEQCYELQPTFQLLLQRPDRLALNLDEATPFTERLADETGRIHFVSGIQEMEDLVNFKMHQLYQVQVMGHQNAAYPDPISHTNGPRVSSPGKIEDTEMPLASTDNGNVQEEDGLGEDTMVE